MYCAKLGWDKVYKNIALNISEIWVACGLLKPGRFRFWHNSCLRESGFEN